jgi:hypothetical protein
MGLVEGILIVAVVSAIAVAVVAGARRRGSVAPGGLDDVLGVAHDEIDEIELARVRSMLQRR